MTVAKLLFGRGAYGRRLVTDSGWRDFLAREVTPRFPDGLTTFDAAGQWRDPPSGTISREASKVVMIAFRGDPTAHERLNAIAEAYKRRFSQKSVGIVISSACVSF
jgi:hypothetical protein